MECILNVAASKSTPFYLVYGTTHVNNNSSQAILECGILYICFTENCLDRHADKNPDKTALIWEMYEQKHMTMTYRYHAHFIYAKLHCSDKHLHV